MKPERLTVETDESGKFAFVHDRPVAPGTYRVWAELVDRRGAWSGPSIPVTITAELTTYMWILWIVIPAATVCLILFLIFLFFRWLRNRTPRQKAMKDNFPLAKRMRVMERQLDRLRSELLSDMHILEELQEQERLTGQDVRALKEKLESGMGGLIKKSNGNHHSNGRK